MPSAGRRTLLTGAVGGLVAAIGGGAAAQQYVTRNHLQFRPLSAENESDAPTELVVTIVDESGDREETVHEAALAPTGTEDASAVLRGPSLKYPAPYAVRARRTDDGDAGERADGSDLSLSNAAIIDRLPETNWGSKYVSVAVVVESDGTLSARVEPRSTE